MRGLLLMARIGCAFLLAACTRDNAAYEGGAGEGDGTSPGEEGEGTRTDGADGVVTESGSGSATGEPVTSGSSSNGSGPDSGPEPDTSADGPSTTDGPPQDCCMPVKEPGCSSDPSLETEVCNVRPDCCDVAWDEQCVALLPLVTDETCNLDPQACCTPSDVGGCENPYVEECVCSRDSGCCESIWHFGCIVLAAEQCSAPCDLPSTCCFPHFGGGCEDPAVEECVCNLHPDCCDSEWTESPCVDAANDCRGKPCSGV